MLGGCGSGKAPVFGASDGGCDDNSAGGAGTRPPRPRRPLPERRLAFMISGGVCAVSSLPRRALDSCSGTLAILAEVDLFYHHARRKVT